MALPPPDQARLAEMDRQTINAHVRFQIAVHHALMRLAHELDEIVTRAEAARKGEAK